MDNNRTITELEAQISALKKQLKNIAEEGKKKEEKLTAQINTLKAENSNLMNLLKLIMEILMKNLRKLFLKRIF